MLSALTKSEQAGEQPGPHAVEVILLMVLATDGGVANSI